MEGVGGGGQTASDFTSDLLSTTSTDSPPTVTHHTQKEGELGALNSSFFKVRILTQNFPPVRSRHPAAALGVQGIHLATAAHYGSQHELKVALSMVGGFLICFLFFLVTSCPSRTCQTAPMEVGTLPPVEDQQSRSIRSCLCFNDGRRWNTAASTVSTMTQRGSRNQFERYNKICNQRQNLVHMFSDEQPHWNAGTASEPVVT